MPSTDGLNKIVNANEAGIFKIDQETSAFLSFDISSLPKTEEFQKIILSLFLEQGNSIPDLSEFIIYPINTETNEVGDRGLIIKTETKVGSFVSFAVPLELFGSQNGKIGFIIRTTENSTFIFHGHDEGSTIRPKLIIVHDEVRDNEFTIPADMHTKIDELLAYAKKSDTKNGEILKLSPEFYGIRVNLRTLWEKIRKCLFKGF